MKYPKGTTEHPINKSGKRKILVSVWDFGAVYPQSERGYYVCNDHPAKMRPSLARAILELYGESPVLDPMAGIGTTLVEAMLLGMDAVGVEYEQKFVDQANKNIHSVQETFPSKNLGKAVCVRGDARNLSTILKTDEARSILFSPPYWKAMRSELSTEEEAMEKHRSSVDRAKRVGGKPISKALARASLGYGTSRNNIGNVARFGSVFFSPPYFDALSMNKGGGSKNSILHEERTQDLQRKRSGPFAIKKNLPTPYSSKRENIGNQRDYGIGSVVLSPPYADALSRQGGRQFAYTKGQKGDKFNDDSALPYSDGINNIGNMAGQTYLGEMFKVYRECYRVLKPGKFMVVVVKDIQRNWKTIPLGADTIKLCQLAGFDCHDVIINKMYFPSFWVLSLAKKSQEERGTHRFHALKSHEYVLVFRKS